MTMEEMKRDIREYCADRSCDECVFRLMHPCPRSWGLEGRSDEAITLLHSELPRDTNQEAKADAGKLKITLVPRQIIREIAAVRMYGNQKYPEGGGDNWKKVEPQRYRDALMRHLLAYLDDPDSVDEESGLPHLSHAACNIAFLCELVKEGKA